MAKKLKVVIVSDDIRFPSGVSNITKQIILNTIGDFDWVQMSARYNQVENNSIIDVSDSVKKITNVNDAYVRLYCTSGYGDYATYNKIVNSENPDILLHMSDPHYFNWIYEHEHEIRKKIPIGYYHVWDNEPVPVFNKSIYYSCDSIASISKLTYKLVNNVTNGEIDNEYIPHGINTEVFKKLDEEQTNKCRLNLLNTGCSFVLFCNNKNLKRKQLLNLLESYQVFCESIKKEDANRTLLLLHTNPIGRNTSNLYEASDYINTLGNVKFSDSVVDDSTLAQMYNVADVTINIASNEGFGLSTIESLSCETPIIVNKTGGLNEQIDNDNTWGIGISPSSRVLNGSPSVPFLYEDILDKQSVSDAIYNIYKMSNNKRTRMGKSGRNFIIENQYTSRDMTNKFTEYIKNTIKNFKPRSNYTLTKI